jgi:hypothetical protein
VAGKGMAVAGKGVIDITNKLGGATLASLEVRLNYVFTANYRRVLDTLLRVRLGRP